MATTIPHPYSTELTGKERDAESGLDYFGARYMSAAQGRFLSVDPSLDFKKRIIDPQLWNGYAYVGNNPLGYIDPDGRERMPCAGFAQTGSCGALPWRGAFTGER